MQEYKGKRCSQQPLKRPACRHVSSRSLYSTWLYSLSSRPYRNILSSRATSSPFWYATFQFLPLESFSCSSSTLVSTLWSGVLVSCCSRYMNIAKVDAHITKWCTRACHWQTRKTVRVLFITLQQYAPSFFLLCACAIQQPRMIYKCRGTDDTSIHYMNVFYPVQKRLSYRRVQTRWIV